MRSYMEAAQARSLVDASRLHQLGLYHLHEMAHLVTRLTLLAVAK